MSRRAWFAVALAAITGVCLIRFGMKFPWAQTVATLAGSDWRLLGAAAVVNLASLVAKAAAWHLVLRRLAPLPATVAQGATFAGAAVNAVSVSVSGEAARAQFVVARSGLSFGTAVVSLVISRLLETAGLLVVLCTTSVVAPPWPAARLAGAVIGAAAVALVLLSPRLPWARLWPLAAWRRNEALVRMAASMTRGDLAGAVGLTTLSWVAQWATYHWSIAATHTPVSLPASLSALAVANVAGILRFTPSNIGVMQGSLILGMRAFGIPAAAALAAGLALQAVQVIPVLMIGMAIAGRSGFRQLATAVASEPRSLTRRPPASNS